MTGGSVCNARDPQHRLLAHALQPEDCLGAALSDDAQQVVADRRTLAAAGLTIGVTIALGTSRFIESLLFNIRPNDPWALAAAVTLLVSAALLAGYGPARRASRIGPMIALRHE
ncbi:MAG TPA: hypothetical protein VFB99_19255 [Vicinamibacterales bacterium]|nr:hypothetical protein [Vicinamibacterales bacterium]